MEYLRSVSGGLPDEFQQYLPGHGDVILAESIKKAKENGTDIVMDVKMVREPTRIPPTYIAYPVPEIMDVEPETGLINDMLDIDGFSRQYSIGVYGTRARYCISYTRFKMCEVFLKYIR